MKKRLLTIPFLILSILLIMNLQNQVEAAPIQQESNLLNNASLEQPYVNGAADKWSAWHMESERTDSECLSGYHYKPKWNMETNGSFVADGVASQYIGNNWDTWGGGVYQTVNVTPGVTYRFSFSAKGRTTSESSPAPSEAGINMNIRAGIDPNGSGLWQDGDVVWGASGSPHDTWQQFSVEATATGDKITVFTSADLGVPGVNQCRQFLDTWFDNAQLVTAGPPPANTPPPAPPATAVPASTPTALPSPTSEVPATTEPQATTEPSPTEESSSDLELTTGGTICVNAFHDVNANGLHDLHEGYMAEVTITVATQSTIVGSMISEGSESPKCFYNLEPGPYQVAQQVPAQLQMTSAANAAVETSADTTVGVKFGSRVRGAPVVDAAPDDQGGAEAAESSGQDMPTTGGIICVNAFHDENGNGVNDPEEGYMAGVILTVTGEIVPVGQVVSTGSEMPHCFGGLDQGPYEVTQEVPDLLEMTTADSAVVALTDGMKMQLEFGSRLQLEDTSSTSSTGSADTGDTEAQVDEETDGGGLDLLALSGLGVIIIGVILLGALIFFLLRR